MVEPTTDAISVLIVDDQQLVRAGLRAILDQLPGIAVCGEAQDGHDAIDLTRSRRPDVVLMDIGMPGLDGIEATRRIVAEQDPARPAAVIMLTTFDLDAHVYDALRAGASGFLLKDVPPDDLARAIHIVAGGDALIAPAITKRLIEQFTRSAPDRARQVDLEVLTPREVEVLALVARGLSNAEIAEELVLGAATVKTHVRRILSKLDARDRVHVVVLAYEAGLVHPGDRSSG